MGMVHPGLALGCLHVDHWKPVALGGKHIDDNLRLTHARCNLRKGARMVGVGRGRIAAR